MLALFQLSDVLMETLWALMRVTGLVLIAPLLGAVFVPTRVRVMLAAILAVAMLPVLGDVPTVSPLSPRGFLIIAQEMMIGLALGFTLKLVIEAAVFAGQVISMGMGLAFAMVVDPQAGSTPLLGRLYIIVATLLMLATNAHLALIGMLGDSYAVLPIGEASLSAGSARELVGFASVMFSGAMQLALPAVIAILMVNVAFGVISRSAPTLNLFAVGFPITLMLGMLIMTASVRSHGVVWEGLFTEALSMMARLLGAN